MEEAEVISTIQLHNSRLQHLEWHPSRDDRLVVLAKDAISVVGMKDDELDEVCRWQQSGLCCVQWHPLADSALCALHLQKEIKVHRPSSFLVTCKACYSC